uniref:Small ribosomal subunit protein mS31 n=1 Tax=Latimeria chalumnae TaxID=7897 RepID=H3AM76_LATCH
KGEDKAFRQLSTSAALCNDKDKPPPETNPLSKDAEESAETESPKAEKRDLLSLIGGMKVEVSSRKKFQALRMQRAKEQAKETLENMESATSMFQKATMEQKAPSKESLNPELLAAAAAVAASMPFNKGQIESELLQQLRKHEAETEAQKRGESSNISNYKKKRDKPQHHYILLSNVSLKFTEEGSTFANDYGFDLDPARSRKGLYSGRRLNIFSATTESETGLSVESSLTLWDIELANQIASTTRQLPRNGFEEMIQWTKEGKLWEFPVNNEAGLEEEQKVEFYEHIFLERHLEDFPKKGPVRHFMELVTNGLSKNPHLTVKQKVEHIEWFRDYFQQKEDILKESEIYLS